jgi:hypothetical protein
MCTGFDLGVSFFNYRKDHQHLRIYTIDHAEAQEIV